VVLNSVKYGKLKLTFAGYICVGFVAAAVSMPMGGCRARRPVGVSSVAVVIVDVIIAVRLAVL